MLLRTDIIYKTEKLQMCVCVNTKADLQTSQFTLGCTSRGSLSLIQARSALLVGSARPGRPFLRTAEVPLRPVRSLCETGLILKTIRSRFFCQMLPEIILFKTVLTLRRFRPGPGISYERKPSATHRLLQMLRTVTHSQC